MIVAEVICYPFGDKTDPKSLGKIQVTNEGTGTRWWGNYRVTMTTIGKDGKSETYTARFKGFERRKYDVVQLLKKAIEAVEKDTEYSGLIS